MTNVIKKDTVIIENISSNNGMWCLWFKADVLSYGYHLIFQFKYFNIYILLHSLEIKGSIKDTKEDNYCH